jgi:hypothetical protein
MLAENRFAGINKFPSFLTRAKTQRNGHPETSLERYANGFCVSTGRGRELAAERLRYPAVPGYAPGGIPRFLF